MTGARKLADYPGRKMIVACDRCGWRKQYDKAGMIIAGGADRPLTLLVDAIARKKAASSSTSPARWRSTAARRSTANSPIC